MNDKSCLRKSVLIVYSFLISDKESEPTNYDLLQAYNKISPLPFGILIVAIIAENLLSRHFTTSTFISLLFYLIVMLGIPLAIISSIILFFIGLKIIIKDKLKQDKQFKFYFSFISAGAPLVLLFLVFLYIKFSNPMSFPPLK